MVESPVLHCPDDQQDHSENLFLRCPGDLLRDAAENGWPSRGNRDRVVRDHSGSDLSGEVLGTRCPPATLFVVPVDSHWFFLTNGHTSTKSYPRLA